MKEELKAARRAYSPQVQTSHEDDEEIHECPADGKRHEAVSIDNAMDILMRWLDKLKHHEPAYMPTSEELRGSVDL